MNQVLNISIFLVLAFISLWSITTDYNKTNQLESPANKVYAEIFMDKFEMISMDEQGKPDYILTGLRLLRYSNSDNTEIKQPVFQLLQENKQWKVSADKALINDKNETHGIFKQIQAGGMIRHAAAGFLFENAPLDLVTLLERDENGEALTSFDLDGKISMRQRSTHETIYSPNVVAVLPGSDPLLANEYVVYTAHLDHIGELHSEGSEEGQSDLINNGALDNASGISVMLETARLFAQGESPRRSILFVAVTAEEKGLVGSEYFAMNPTVPIGSIVSELNLDMPVLLYDFGDVIAFGAEHSSLGNTVREAAQSFGIELTPDPFPEQNIFVRSDHYRFVQQGVPSVYLVTGVKSLDGTVDTQAIFEGFLQEHYHKPSDDLNLPIHYGAAERFTRINAKIGEMIANEAIRPSWHEGDFFGRTYAK